MSDTGLLVFLPPAAIVLAIAGSVILSIRAERRRSSAWEAVALRNGYRFDRILPPDDLPFDLFGRGHSRRNRNAVSWTEGSCSLRLSDYQYTVHRSTGRGSNSHTYKQTICLLRDPGMALPAFLVRKEKAVLDWIGQKLGMKDIDFPEDEAFSKAFVLKGDESLLRSVFDSETRALLLSMKDCFSTLEGAGDALLLNCGRRIPPEGYGLPAGAAVQLHARLAGRHSW
ncbi:hypothetical protein GX411_08230 [Candidatus Fermentibacteria bacterium]|nr:hypothetical protein [Candidatus Fermentibacteria bacterium]